MANDKLEAFLSANSGAQEPPPAPATEPPAAPPPDPAPSQPDKPQPTQEPSQPQHEPDDEEPRDARIGEPAVPRSALEDERAKRRDWKGKADRLEGEAAELRKQLEELRKPPPAPQPPPQPAQQYQFPDPVTHPAEYQAEMLANHAFNVSELLARDKYGDEAVDKLVSDFAQMAQGDPMLWAKLRQQRHPFEWARREVQRQGFLREVSDPEAYKAKLRAEWEAERAAQAPPAVATPTNTPPPNMPPSLANVRSAAPRQAPQWSGPLSDAQAANYFREHRMSNRH
jgi:hypothetical protein